MLCKFRLIFFSVVFVILFVKCNEEPTELGLGILPQEDLLSLITIDSLNVISTNVFPYELFPTGDIVMIGSLNDPVFGKTKASLLTEFGPVRTNLYPIPPANRKIADTLMIYLRWMNNYSGENNSDIKMQVFLLKDTLPTSSKYHRGNFNISDFIDPVPIAEKTVDLSESDTIITIMLPQVYANAIATIDSNSYTNDKLFREALKKINLNGFYITTQDAEGTGTITTYSFFDPVRNLTDSVSYNLLFTYHTENDANHKDFWFTFSSFTNDESVAKKKNYFYPKINVIEHDYSLTKFYNELNGVQSDSLLYVHGPSGVKVKIDMSVLDSFVNKENNTIIDVAKAELIVPTDTTIFRNVSKLKIPARLSLQVATEFGGNQVTMPYYFYYKPFNESFTNGNRNSKAYVFNITEYVQEYLNGRTRTKELYITAPFNEFTVNGVALKRDNIKFNLIYSKFKTN